jgi:hypothetical protein
MNNIMIAVTERNDKDESDEDLETIHERYIAQYAERPSMVQVTFGKQRHSTIVLSKQPSFDMVHSARYL